MEPDKLDLISDFSVIEVLQENERYNVYLISHEEEQRILKIAQDPKLISNIAKDIRISGYLTELSDNNQKSFYHVRQIHSSGKGWFIGEYLNHPPLVEHRSDLSQKDVVAVAENMLAPCLAELNSYTPSYLRNKSYYMESNGQYNSKYYRQRRDIVKWISKAEKEKLITQTQSRRVLDYIEGNARMIKCGIEMWDMEPWEMIRLPSKKVGLIDLEYTRINGRAFFDLVWNYLRFWIELRQPEAAKIFWQSFLKTARLNEDEDFPAIMAGLGMKLMGYLDEAVIYMDESDDDNVFNHDYSKETLQELINKYLSFDIYEFGR